MKVNVWKVSGLVMALMGAITVAQAKQGQRGEQGQRGKGAGQGQECEKPERPEQGKRPGRPTREQIMKKYDVDGNGELSEDERAALRADREKRRANRPAPSPEQEGKRPERPTREQIMQRFDTDGNGELSEEERREMRKAFEARRRKQAEQQGE